MSQLEPAIVELPIPEPIRETYLEVRLAQTHTVTISCAIEGFYLSPGGALAWRSGQLSTRFFLQTLPYALSPPLKRVIMSHPAARRHTLCGQ